MCPDWESNRRPFGLQANTQPIGPHQPGPCLSLLLSFMCIHTCIGMCLCIYMLLHSPSGSEAASCESASLSLSLSLSLLSVSLCHGVSGFISLSLCLPHGVICACPLVPAVRTGCGSMYTLVRGCLAFHPPPPLSSSEDAAFAGRVCG